MEQVETLQAQEPAKPSPARAEKFIRIAFASFWIGLGIVFPLVVLVAEAVFGICGEVFVDPIPTVWHALLIALVPASNVLILRAIRTGKTRYLTQLTVLNGLALGIAAVYTVVFIPLLPVAVIYTAMTFWAFFLPAFITLLPCGPLASLIGTARFSAQLRPVAESAGVPFVNLRRAGIVLGVVAIGALEAPRTLSRIAVQRLALNPSDTATLSLARSFASRDALRAAAYGDLTPQSDFVGWISTVITLRTVFDFDNFGGRERIDTEAARRVYFQVTGERFNLKPAPTRRAPVASSFMRRQDVGGEQVGAISEDVALTESAVDSSVSAETLTTYTEWTMTFRNSGQQREEARTEILLPQDGVVSRATLWINDEPVEALFGSRTQAQVAYRQVVSAARDPLLVTTSGPDRILVQCFPIEPSSEMKIRIGITAPIALADRTGGRFVLPRILDRNFLLAPALRHHVWIDSRSAVTTTTGGLLAEHPEPNVYGVRGALSPSELEAGPIEMRMALGEDAASVLSLDAIGEKQIVRQSIVEKRIPPASGVVFVIDGSKSMKPSLPELLDALRALPSDLPFAVVLSGDSPELLTNGFEKASTQRIGGLVDVLRGHSFTGGANNVAALIAGWDTASSMPNARILWIHGPAPVTFPGLNELEQRRSRRPNGPTFFSIEAITGADRTLEQIDRLGFLEDYSQQEDGRTIAQKVAPLVAGGSVFELDYSARMPEQSELSMSSYEHVNRLWAAKRVEEMVRYRRRTGSGESYPQEASALAVSYKLVTQASGAVVLAKSDQALHSELQPQEPGQVPVIPEPELAALFAVALLILASHLGKSRRVYAR